MTHSEIQARSEQSDNDTRLVRVEVALNRMGYWRADAYRDGERIATYGAAGSVADALRKLADNPALREER